MASIEFKSTPDLAGSRVNYAHAVKVGPFIFLTGHEAFDFATGSVAAVNGPPGFPLFGLPRYRREGDFILKRMRRILKEFGSDLSHGVRLDQYYPIPEPVDPYHLSRRAEFGDYIPPSTSVVMERCFNAATSISASLIAVVPSADYKIEHVNPQGVTSPNWSGYAPAITCNDFIFVAGQMATDVTEGLHVKARVPDYARWGGSAIRKQTEFLILEKLKTAMEAAGSALENAVKAQVYLEKLEDFPEFIDVWNKYFAAIPCAVTVVPTKSFGVADGIIEINLIGLRAGAKRRKQIVDVALPDMAAYGPCVRVGEFLFPSGLMAIGTDGRIAGAAISPSLAGIAHAGSVQAAAIYDYVEIICAAAGTSPANIVRAQYFVADVRDFAGISAAWTGRYGAQPHPFVCVQVPAPLPATGAALIADFWIYIPS
jgi:enamine deaminase RidA (YjgF/YER057c/UK114 family)